MKVYADNAATTKISTVALDILKNSLENIYGNPSSLHSVGQIAAEELRNARNTVAKYLGAAENQIYFTSGGSESNNQAILSAAYYGERKGKKHIISSNFEHHSVLHTLKKLETKGFEVTYVNVSPDGLIDPYDISDSIKEDTCLVTVMFANNEIGTIQPIEEIGKICKEKKVLFHTDAVQAAGHIHIDVNKLNLDYLSMSAHKFGGPKGIGVLFAKKKAQLSNLIDGGAQEQGKRAGTENVPAIMALAAAFEDSCNKIDTLTPKILEMRNRLIDGLLQIPHTVLNGNKDLRLPGNVNVCFEGIEGESLLLILDCNGVSASSGSACTSGSLEPSHVLLSIGRPHEVAHGSLRLSIDHNNTVEEIDYIIDTTKTVVEKLRAMSPVWDDLMKGRRNHVI